MNILLFLSFSICTASFVENINIIGNDHTQSHIILREIYHPIPDKFDSTLAQDDRNRIYNLGLFSTVEVKQIDSSYTVFLVETLHFFPIPLVDYNEANGWSYGVGIEFINFRGRNQKLTFGGLIGEETTYFLNFKDSWIAGDHVSLKAKLYQYHTENSMYDYNYQENGFYIGTGFYKKTHHKYKIEIGMEIINLDTINNTIPQYKHTILLLNNFLKAKYNYQYDTRDIYIDPTNGLLFSISLLPKYHIKNPELSYYRLFIHRTSYFLLSKNLNDLVLSFKSAALLQQSKSFPIFANVYVGGEDFIRGYSPNPNENKKPVEKLIEGYNILFQSIVLQHTLFKRTDYGNVEMGIDLVYFLDMGIVSDTYYSFQTEDLIIGYGFGLRLFTSGIGTIRIDLGFNPYGGWNWHPSDGLGHHSDRMD